MLNSNKGLGCRLICVCAILAVILEMICCVDVASAERLGNGRRGRMRTGQNYTLPRNSVPAVTKTTPETGTVTVQDEHSAFKPTVSPQTQKKVSSTPVTKPAQSTVSTPVAKSTPAAKSVPVATKPQTSISKTTSPALAMRTDGTSTPAVAPAPETLPPAPCFWFSNLNTARQAATELGRPILLHFYMAYCPPCKRMEETVFPKSSIQTLAGLNFVMVKLAREQNMQLCSQLGVQSFPADVILSPDGKIIAKHVGFQDVSAYTTFLTAAINQVKLPAMDVPVGPNWKEQAQLAKAKTAMKNSPVAPTLAIPALEPEAEVDSGIKPESKSEIKKDEEATDLLTLEAPAGPAISVNTNQKEELPLAQEMDLLSMETSPQTSSEEVPDEQFENRIVPENETKVAEVARKSNQTKEIKPVNLNSETKYLMDGYCPVSMVEKNEWVRGNENLTASFEGGTYCFATEVEKEKFEQNPRFYALVSSGCDIVVLTETDQKVEGSRRFGIRYGSLNFVFANPENREKFRTNPDFYAARVQDVAVVNGSEATR